MQMAMVSNKFLGALSVKLGFHRRIMLSATLYKLKLHTMLRRSRLHKPKARERSIIGLLQKIHQKYAYKFTFLYHRD